MDWCCLGYQGIETPAQAGMQQERDFKSAAVASRGRKAVLGHMDCC